ncbi:unnamed protein product, partial [Polarella glacialis]
MAAAPGEPGLSPGAAVLFTAVLRPQPNLETARRFFPTLRQWAETGRAYRGQTFVSAEVEDAIAACERLFPGQGGASSSSSASAAPEPAAPAKPTGEGWWPRWAMDATRGIEVLLPSVRGKPPSWTQATPVAIGYRGQKKKYLFLRTAQFEMDCRRADVRPKGGGQTAQQQYEALEARGDTPERHEEWTDGSDMPELASDRSKVTYITPGIAPPNSSSSSASSEPKELTKGEGADASLIEALEDDFERMALLRRSKVVKTKTCDHPDPLGEPRAAASIQLPELGEQDILALPPVVAEARLSSLQLETVCFAARRFRTSLPDGRTAGYMLGDGTGCGKGRVISALLYHMWNMGHRRSIWVSATSDLYYDACRDLQDLGADIPCMPMRRLPPSGPLDRQGSECHKELVRGLGIEGDGVIFLTYSLLVQTGLRREVFACPVRNSQERQSLLGEILDDRLRCTKAVQFGADKINLKAGDHVVGVKSLRDLQVQEVPFTVSFERVITKEGKGASENDSELTAWNSRLGQLVAWLGGGEATGLICFDEVHKAKNLIPDKDDKASTKTGLFVDLLQQSCPKAPVLYVSATAATEVQHLGYMSRLGVWGPGTAFENFHDFMKVISTNGVAAMEMFAINMKAIGAMSCRALAYVGTEFETRQCGMTQEQTDGYDAAALFWQKCLKMFEKFITDDDVKESCRLRFFKKLKPKEDEPAKKKKEKNPDEVKDKDDEDPLGRRLRQFYWGAQQRFFKAMCNVAKVPAACVAAQEAVDRGEQVVMSIWATGEARSRAKMAGLVRDAPGRVIVDTVSDGGLTEVVAKEQDTLKSIISCLYSNLRLRSNLNLGGKQVSTMSRLTEVDGKRITKPEDLMNCTVPCKLIFRSPTSRRIAVSAHLAADKTPVLFELADDALGERVVIVKVIDGPDHFRRAELEGWHIKTINGRPVGKIQVAMIRQRLRKGQPLGFQDAVIDEHLSGPQMILEHFLNSCLITQDIHGVDIPWAVEAKKQLLKEAAALKLPPNAMDAIHDTLGGLRKVAEMSGRSHRMKRRKDGTLAYVARCEELKCPSDQANMVEQVLFQKGAKKICVVTEVASAGISLHADRRQVRKDFQPPRRTMISVELPWGADKAIQCFGRVHRANQLIPPKFIVLNTPLGGEVRFNSAIARRMKLLGAVTKGDRMTSMGGVGDKAMTDYDVNNMYGQRALATFYTDTVRALGALPELLALYEGLPFIGAQGDGEASGVWPTWEDFAQEVSGTWGKIHLNEDMRKLVSVVETRIENTDECSEINRFFNRILMLEVPLQNAMFETFFSIYSELVRVDKANGTYDSGIENLNDSQGRRVRGVEVDSMEVLYKDPASGAQTRYVKLRLDRGISWEAAKEAFDEMEHGKGSIEGWHAFRRQPDSEPIYLLVKELVQLGGAGASGSTWFSRRRKKMFTIWRADCGARSGVESGRRAFNQEDFTENEQYTRLSGSEEDLATVEAGWTKLYTESLEVRIGYEHILTGDVLTAWRLVQGGKSPAKNAEEEQKLQIVRATTQPDGEPVVGMRLAEEDLPKLKYILACQQVFAEENLTRVLKARVGVREAAGAAADLLLKLLWAAPDKSLAFTSWIEAHKALANEGVPRSIDGLRATQMAVEQLVKKKLVTTEEGVMALTRGGKDGEVLQPPMGPELEQILFPEEFEAHEGEIDFDEDRYTDEECSGDDGADGACSDPEEVPAVATPAKPKRKKESPVKKPKREKMKVSPNIGDDFKQRMNERTSKRTRRSKDSLETTKAAIEGSGDEEAMFQELFGEDEDEDGDDMEKALAAALFAEDFEDEDQPEGFVLEPADAPSARKRQRDSEMADALFGDFKDEASDEEAEDETE